MARVLVVWAVSTLTMLALAGLMPDFRLQSEDGEAITTTAVTAAWGAGAFGLLGALVWPLVVRALLLVPALVLGLLVFFLNGSLLLVALRLIPDGGGEAAPDNAVVVAAVMSAVASATSTALAVRDDNAYRRRLSRLAGRRGFAGRDPGPPAGSPPGLLFVQLDGVGHRVLRDAVGQGLMPTVATWLRTTHRLTPWRTDWSSQTGASQLGILHGSNHDVPAFRWYEKDTGRLMVTNRPASAAEMERRAVARTADGGLLTVDGASRGNLFGGGAEQLALVLSGSARMGRGSRSRAGYFAYFRDPANSVRTAVSCTAEVFREIGQSVRARLAGERPRVGRGGLYPFIRAFATVVERDVVVSAVMGDLLAGRAAVYADLVAYDEVAHHSGPHSRDAARVLRRLDRSLALIAEAVEHAPRPYRLVLLSDHGQSPGETFESAYGLTLKDLVRAASGLPVPRRAQRTRSGAEARYALRSAVRLPSAEWQEEPAAGHDSEPVVLASGNLGLISFPDVPHRLTREEIDRRHPALLRTLADHPGIGFLLVRSERHGSVVLARDGQEVPVRELTDGGPLAVFGPGAAAAVRRTDGFAHVADIMVNSRYDPATGEVHAFEEQIGSHGGLGGEQSEAFLLSPLVLSPPVGEGGRLVGAEAVHRVLRRWLREGLGPQVPIAPAAAAARETSVHKIPAPGHETSAPGLSGPAPGDLSPAGGSGTADARADTPREPAGDRNTRA
ncbi:phage holin family protein [Streptomyces sp. LP05-1]|uniref:Phage holin family protein n=2 Tax=Streptomyces pyxinae TaxID=2970734 RepID=A0ABT2CM99_9ACTN|nr:alkaline phosphatase family protein [Streptomyces sp. LP05-1]MCS0638560.1 phage holin family protein [Streptomyces sp. LP05-1]